MSLEKAMKIIQIIDNEAISKTAKMSFNNTINVIKYYTNSDIIESISPKINDIIMFMANEIILAKAKDVQDAFSEDELDFILKEISNPIVIKLFKTISTPSDKLLLRIASLEMELVHKFIDVIKQEDKEMAKDIELAMDDYFNITKSKNRVLN